MSNKAKTRLNLQKIITKTEAVFTQHSSASQWMHSPVNKMQIHWEGNEFRRHFRAKQSNADIYCSDKSLDPNEVLHLVTFLKGSRYWAQIWYPPFSAADKFGGQAVLRYDWAKLSCLLKVLKTFSSTSMLLFVRIFLAFLPHIRLLLYIQIYCRVSLRGI